jgi:hypothetical protein
VRAPLQKALAWWRKTSAPLKDKFNQVLPAGLADFGLPDRLMVFIAVAVPVVVVTFAVVVYSRPGRQSLYQQAYDQAAAVAQQAAAVSDPDTQRTGWEMALFYLDEAEGYLVTDESTRLRTQLQSALDNLDAIQRVDLQNAVLGGLGKNVQVTRIATAGADVYLLNGAEGNVLHLQRSGSAYEEDITFRCGPGGVGSPVGALVDLVAIEYGSAGKTILLSVDEDGTLLRCSPGENPIAAALPTPPGSWGRLAAFELESNILYALDPAKNKVWLYSGQNNTFNEAPQDFFEEVTAIPDLTTVVDMTMHHGAMFFLHADGSLTTCTSSGLTGSLTSCTSPATYQDGRAGRVSATQMAGTRFVQLHFNPLTGPSLYFLDASTNAVFRFSLALNLNTQYRPRAALPAVNATAFAINANRLLFLALGNELYFGPLP